MLLTEHRRIRNDKNRLTHVRIFGIIATNYPITEAFVRRMSDIGRWANYRAARRHYLARYASATIDQYMDDCTIALAGRIVTS